MNVRIEGNRKKPTKQWPKNLYYECEFIAEHYMNTLVKFWNFSHRISRLRAIDCSNCDCVSRHDDCSRGWDFISGIWPFSNFFLNMGREGRWPRWIKKGVAYRYQATVRAQTFTLEPRYHTSYTCGLVWAVNLWISGHGSTMCTNSHACMPVWKLYNPVHYI